MNIREDFEFYQLPSGKVGVDKVVTTTSKSGLAFNDGTDNGNDTSMATKRVPFQKMSQSDKELAKAAYKTLKQTGSIDDVGHKFKTSPRPDVVMKSDGAHADIYYDSNKDGEPDEKDVRIAASRKRTAYQQKHTLTESCDPEVREVVVNIREIAYDYYKAHKDEGDGVWDAYVALADAVDYFIKEDENSNYSYQRALNKLDDAIDTFAEFDEDFAEELWEEAAELHQIAEHQTESKTRSLFKTLLHESNEVCLAAARDLIDADDIGDAITDACGAGGASDYKNLILDLQSGKFALAIGEADTIADELYDAGYDAEAEELADIIAPVRQLSESHRK